MKMICPHRWVLTSELSHTNSPAHASAGMYPFSGMGTISESNSRPSSEPTRSVVIGVRTTPGPIAFNGIPAPAHSGEGAALRSQRLNALLFVEYLFCYDCTYSAL